MTKQTVPDLKELFKQAAEIAKQVPESMQEAAFNRAVDLLTGAGAAAPARVPKAPRGRTKSEAEPLASAEVDSPVAHLLAQIDSTQHPGVRTSVKVLDRALMVLQIARTEHGVDGMGPSDIAKVLTDKFRVGTSVAAVRMALSRATNLVNRVPHGGGFVYRIMAPGEEHLAALGEAAPTAREPGASPAQPSHRSKPRTASKKKKAGQEEASARRKKSRTEAQSKQVPGAKGKSNRKLGPKAAVVELIASGYFAAARTGPEVKDFLRTKRGFDFGVPQLQLAMLRLVRDGVLDRDPNADGNYEYKVP